MIKIMRLTQHCPRFGSGTHPCGTAGGSTTNSCMRNSFQGWTAVLDILLLWCLSSNWKISQNISCYDFSWYKLCICSDFHFAFSLLTGRGGTNIGSLTKKGEKFTSPGIFRCSFMHKTQGVCSFDPTKLFWPMYGGSENLKIPIRGSNFKVFADLSSDLSKQARQRH